MVTLTTREFAAQTGLTKNATNDTWETVIGNHGGTGNEDFTITLSAGTNRAVRKVVVSCPNLTGSETFHVYRGTVAAGTAITTDAMPLFNGAVEFRNPTVFDSSVVTVRINSTATSPVYISVWYDYN